jgi:hypothetical protein
MAVSEIRVTIAQGDSANRGRLIESLRTFLADSIPEADCRLERRDEHAMDMGTALVLLAGTPSAVAIAKGLSAWIKKAGEPAIQFEKDGVKIVLRHDMPDEIKRELVLEALRGHKEPERR